MTNNDILRRLRYIFDFSDSKMIEVFALADYQASRPQISDWLKKDGDPSYRELSDTELAIFLNGLINDRRGKREVEPPRPDKRLNSNIIRRAKKEKEPPELEKRLNNNIVFMKLKIALNLKAEDVLEIMGLAGLHLSKHELSAFFRKPDHKHYRECRDQILRNFLRGLQLRYRDGLQVPAGCEEG